tara:strand:- start:609 stop:785 length:177 start_codon:yes stop_codon:yes gene_type:complete
MLLFNVLVPVVYLLAAVGTYDNVVKPAAKATYETGVVVYEKTVDVVKDITTDDPIESE